MRIDVYATYEEVTLEMIRSRLVVVIDLLRATTTIIQAIESDADMVIPVCEISQAVALAHLHRSRVLLAGERKGQRIEGFDLGNSPQTMTPEAVRGKTLVITTTNGTCALERVKDAHIVLLGALANKSAIAECIASLNLDVSIVCAGTEGRFSADDIYCAGAIINSLRKLTESLELSDLARVAASYYQSARNDRTLVASSWHYSRLVRMGFEEDVEFCFMEDSTGVVPVYKNGIVRERKASESIDSEAIKLAIRAL